MALKRKSNAKIILAVLGGILMVLLMVLLLLPYLNRLCSVSVATESATVNIAAPLPDKPETVPVTVYYIMEESSKKISQVYVEIFHSETQKAYYMEIPTDTRVNLSEELYKSLQTYGPELPQHLKLANVAESFSTEYGLTAGNRVLSEVLGISLTEYVRVTLDVFQDWLRLQAEEKTPSGFFEAYGEWIGNTTSGQTVEERWSYYESRKEVTDVITETAPGSREKDGYRISSKRTKERLEEIMRGTEPASEPEE